MLHAVQTPVLKLAMVGAAGIATMAGASALQTPSHAVRQHLALHAPVRPGAIYLTAFADGDVTVQLADSRPYRITFTITATLPDRCDWQATEVLDPIDATTYAYSYDEEMLGCAPGAEPQYIPTPRTGTVTVED